MTDFTTHDLGGGLAFLTGSLLPELVWDASQFGEAWQLHPDVKPFFMMLRKRESIANAIDNLPQNFAGGKAYVVSAPRTDCV